MDSNNLLAVARQRVAAREQQEAEKQRQAAEAKKQQLIQEWNERYGSWLMEEPAEVLVALNAKPVVGQRRDRLVDLQLEYQGLTVLASPGQRGNSWDVFANVHFSQPTLTVSCGCLADAVLVFLADCDEQKARKQAEEEAQQAAENEQYTRNRTGQERERAAQQAENDARYEAMKAEEEQWRSDDAVIQQRVETAKAKVVYQWPVGCSITLYKATWQSGWEQEEGTAYPIYTSAWTHDDQPDGKGYFTFPGLSGDVKPPAETLTWQQYEFWSLDQLPAELKEDNTVTIPGIVLVKRAVAQPERYGLGNFDTRTEHFYVYDNDSYFRAVAGERPLPWVEACFEQIDEEENIPQRDLNLFPMRHHINP